MAKEIPGPKGWPLVGNIGQFDTGKLHTSMYDLQNEHGGLYQVSILGKTIIVISDLDLMNKAFSEKEICHRPNNYVKWLKYDGAGYLDSNFTEKELKLKSVLWKTISSAENDKTLAQYTERDLEKFLDSLKTTENVPIVESLTRAGARQIAIYMTGVAGTDKQADDILEFLGDMNNLIIGGKSSLLAALPWLRFVPSSFKWAVDAVMTSREKVIETLMNDVKKGHTLSSEHGILQHLLAAQDDLNNEISDVTETLINDAKKGYTPGSEHGILQHLLAAQENPENEISEVTIKACTLDLLFNGGLPTGQNVAYILLQALEYPDMQGKIHEELKNIDKNTAISDIKLDNLPFTEAFILESMRYLTLVNISVPHVVNEETIVDGYIFRKGSLVMGNTFGIHHDENIFENPWEFKPERFLDKTGEVIPASDPIRKSIVHFGVGMRKCRGPVIAMETIARLTVGIFARYKVLPPIDEDLPSSDPRQYRTIAVIDLPSFSCRFEKK